MTMITLYGIKNCDTVKKARRWLDAKNVEYRFHDFRAEGLDEAKVRDWCDKLGWETLLNKRGTTYRQLSGTDKASFDASTAPALLAEHPTLIKRPVFERGGDLHVGFNEADYSRLVG